MLAGLRAAHDLDPEAPVEVRADSKLVVEQMSGRWKIKHADMQDLAAQVREVYPAGHVKYTWVPREKNKHADRLANEAMDLAAKGEVWRPKAPAALDPELVDSATDSAPRPRTTAPGSASGSGAVTVTVAGGSSDHAAKSVTPPAGWGPDLGTPTTVVLLRHGETALTPRSASPAWAATPSCPSAGCGRPSAPPNSSPRAARSRRS